MQLTRIDWKRVGGRAYAKGELAARIGSRDGREVEQRLSVDRELVFEGEWQEVSFILYFSFDFHFQTNSQQ